MTDEVKIEDDWAREKAARQAGAVLADAKPKRSPRLVGGIIAGVVVLVSALVVIVMLVTHTTHKEPERVTRDTGGTVGIEIRAKPEAKIRIDGHKAGTTPLTLHIQKSATPIMIEATLKDRGRDKVVTKQVVPDRDQLVDFTARY